MSRVDFYILPDGAGTERFACSIAKKAWTSGNRVHIHTQSEENAKSMDDLLWTFRDISFIPHELYNGTINEDTPVTIGFGNDFPEQTQVVINLDLEIPTFVKSFERIVEIVGGDETNKQYARQRYKQYKTSDFETHDHKIDKLQDHG
jgi:DNA polymerase III subunit chi